MTCESTLRSVKERPSSPEILIIRPRKKSPRMYTEFAIVLVLKKEKIPQIARCCCMETLHSPCLGEDRRKQGKISEFLFQVKFKAFGRAMIGVALAYIVEMHMLPVGLLKGR